MLGWSARELAERTGLHIATIQRMERQDGPARGNASSVARVERVFEEAGIEFLRDNRSCGVRARLAEPVGN